MLRVQWRTDLCLFLASQHPQGDSGVCSEALGWDLGTVMALDTDPQGWVKAMAF